MSLLRTPEEVEAEVSRRVSLIRALDGWETNVGARVYHGRRVIDRTMVPCAVVFIGDDAPERIKSGTHYHMRHLFQVHAFVDCEVGDPNKAAAAALRDVKRAIFRTDGKASRDWGRIVEDVEYDGSDIAPRADGELYVLAIVQFTVGYVADVADP